LILQEAREVYLKSLELLFQGENEICKQIYMEYLVSKVVNRTEDADNSLKKYYKALLQRFSEEHPAEFNKSNLKSILTELN